MFLATTCLAWSTFGSARAGSAAKPPLTTVASVDLERYAGQWFEIARLPNRFQDDCARNVTAEYSLREDGRISVVNRCITAESRDKAAQGVARIVDRESRAKLKVRFAPAFLSFIPAVWGDYWIIDLGQDYDYAVIGDPRRRYLWILARSSQLDSESLQGILERIEAQGYDTSRLLFTNQSG